MNRPRGARVTRLSTAAAAAAAIAAVLLLLALPVTANLKGLRRGLEESDFSTFVQSEDGPVDMQTGQDANLGEEDGSNTQDPTVIAGGGEIEVVKAKGGIFERHPEIITCMVLTMFLLLLGYICFIYKLPF